MACGWARGGAVSEQIEASINDEFARMRAPRAPVGETATQCVECVQSVSQARRVAFPGVKLCVYCVQERDAVAIARGRINRCGSKDSQLK